MFNTAFVNKTNRYTEFQFHWYYDSTCFGQSFCPSSGVLSHTSALVQFMQFGGRVLPGAWAPGTHGHNSYMVSVGKPRGKRPLSRSKRRSEATIEPDLKLLD
jgi:hypothetical protein